MRVLVCGSRDWTDAALIEAALRQLPASTTIVHGAARGADSLAGSIARRLGFTVEAHPADWAKHGKVAGPIRNAAMLATGIDRVLAFHLGGRGTQDMIDRARRAGVPVTVYGPESVIDA